MSHQDYSNLQLEHLAACLKEAGWTVTLDPGKGMLSEVPDAQRGAWFAAQEVCGKEFDAQFPAPKMTEENWRTLYRHQLWLVDCLEKEGFPPVSTPPSETAYVAEGVFGKTPSWFAWEAVGGVPPDDLEKTCPPAPPGM
jgi:hypothetical protein